MKTINTIRKGAHFILLGSIPARNPCTKLNIQIILELFPYHNQQPGNGNVRVRFHRQDFFVTHTIFTSSCVLN